MKTLKYLTVCLYCSKEENTYVANKKFCSVKCRTIFYGTRNKFPELSTGGMGAISELIVCADLLKNGYAVFRSVSPSAFADVIAVKNGVTRYLEIRTGATYGTTGKLSYSMKISHKEGEPTEFAVYVESTNKIHYIPITKEILEKHKRK